MNRQTYPPDSLFPLRGDLSAENGATKVEVIGLQNILIEPNPLIDNYCPLYSTYTGDIVWGQQLMLFANEYLVSNQKQVDFHAGPGITITDDGFGMLTFTATGMGSGTVTDTLGPLTADAVILGNGGDDIKPGAVLPADATKYYDGTGNFSVPPSGGGVPAGTNVMVCMLCNGDLGATPDYSWNMQLPCRALVCCPASFKFSMNILSGNVTFTRGTVYRMAIGSLVVQTATPITWNGGSTSVVYTTTGIKESDSIALALDATHDWWIVVHQDAATSGHIGYVSSGYLFGIGGITAGDSTGQTAGYTLALTTTTHYGLNQCLST